MTGPGPQRAAPAVRKWKSGDVTRMPALCCTWPRIRHAVSSIILGRVSRPWARTRPLRRLSRRQSGLCPVTSQEMTPSGRCADHYGSPRKPAARAQSDVGGRRSARGKIMLEWRSRGQPLHKREPDRGSKTLRKKSRDRRRCPGIGAGSGRASQYAAKSMMVVRISARYSGPGSV